MGIAALLLAATLTGCGSGSTILTVNGQAITRDQLDAKLENSSSPVTARSVLQLMVTDDLIDQYAQGHKISVTPAEIAKIENQYKAQYPANQWDQLLKARGVNVVATGTAEDTERLRALGADTVVDYSASSVADQIRATYRDGVDALINLAGYTAADVPLDAVRTGGRVATTTGAPDDETFTALGLTGTSIMARPVQEVIAHLAEQVASGSLKVHVGDVLILDQAAEGLATLAVGNARGKIVVTISD